LFKHGGFLACYKITPDALKSQYHFRAAHYPEVYGTR